MGPHPKGSSGKASPSRHIQKLEDYLSDRTIEIDDPQNQVNGKRKIETNCGVPQGSVLGPDLWNLLYDDLAKIALPPDVEMIVFADDMAVFSTSSVPFVIEERLEKAYDDIKNWMWNHGLSLAAEKSEAVVLTKRRVNNQIVVRCDGHDITSQPSVRYLGVQVDQKMGFAEHESSGSSQELGLPHAKSKGTKAEG